jgi:hypothetical protein
MSRVHIDDPDERRQWIEGRGDRLELAREAGWGGLSWWSVAAGVLTLVGTCAVLAGIAAAVLHPLGITMDTWAGDDWKRFGLVAGLVAAAALLGATALGSYAAGRMARRAGIRHGVLVFVVGVIVLAAAGGIAQLEGAIRAVTDRLESMGAPTGDSAWAGVALVVGLAAVGGMLVGSLLGGVRGERWHQRLIARALDPDVGPDADLRAEAERRQSAAAKALARAHKAGVVPGADEDETGAVTWRAMGARAGSEDDEETEFWGTEPEATAAGRPMPPSSRSSGR